MCCKYTFWLFPRNQNVFLIKMRSLGETDEESAQNGKISTFFVSNNLLELLFHLKKEKQSMVKAKKDLSKLSYRHRII